MSLELSTFDFIAALHGKPGELDAWLEAHNEAEVRAAILAYGRAQRERCAVVCAETWERKSIRAGVFKNQYESGELDALDVAEQAIRCLPDMEPQL